MRQHSEKQKKLPFYNSAVKRAYCASAASLLSVPLNSRAARRRQQKNALLEAQGRFIFHQQRDAAASMRYVCGTLAKNGCGAAAVYNLLTDMGHAPALSQVICEAERLGLPVALGLLGSHPARIGRLLEAFGVTAQYLRSEQEFLRLFSPGDRAVICLWNGADVRRGMHFVYARMQHPPLCTAVYNSMRRGSSERPAVLRSTQEIWQHGEFVCAWRVAQK